MPRPARTPADRETAEPLEAHAEMHAQPIGQACNTVGDDSTKNAPPEPPHIAADPQSAAVRDSVTLGVLDAENPHADLQRRFGAWLLPLRARPGGATGRCTRCQTRPLAGWPGGWGPADAQVRTGVVPARLCGGPRPGGLRPARHGDPRSGRADDSRGDALGCAAGTPPEDRPPAGRPRGHRTDAVPRRWDRSGRGRTPVGRTCPRGGRAATPAHARRARPSARKRPARSAGPDYPDGNRSVRCLGARAPFRLSRTLGQASPRSMRHQPGALPGRITEVLDGLRDRIGAYRAGQSYPARGRESVPERAGLPCRAVRPTATHGGRRARGLQHLSEQLSPQGRRGARQASRPCHG